MIELDNSSSCIAAGSDSADAGETLISADWVFGYGSLIWDPGFDYEEASLAIVRGYHRAFCIRSTRYRGTPDQPGIVLGLDRGGSCIGIAFRLKAESRRQAIETLYEREMSGQVYVPKILGASTRCGQQVRALTFVANRDSVAYERLPDMEIVRRLSNCRGLRGQNGEYAIRTWRSLTEHGVHCPHLARVGRNLLGHERS